MPKIKINPEILRSSSQKVQTQISELNSYNAKLASLMEEIHSGWTGNASNQYYNMMQQYQKKAIFMESILAAFKKYSDTAVNTFETLDEECANLINKSF